MVPPEIKMMISEFQCPGCVCGSAPCTTCDKYKPECDPAWGCQNHVAGTTLVPGGTIFLGMPRGFNKVGFGMREVMGHPVVMIRLWDKGEHPDWDHFNIPVWAMAKDGYFFVRTYCPRLNRGFVDVIRGGTWDIIPGPWPVDVANFIDEID